MEDRIMMEENRAKNLAALTAPLPEDIEKLKWHGDFNKALRLIEARLEKDLPEMLKERLRLEREIISRLPLQYPYTTEQAMELAAEKVGEFTVEELENLIDDNAVDWLFIEGERRIKDDFFDNLVKTRADIRERVYDKSLLDDGIQEGILRDQTVKKMKESGGLAYYFHIRTTMKLREDVVEQGKKVRVYLPIPLEYSQVRNFRILYTSMEPFCTAPPLWPQRTVCFEAEAGKDNSFSIEYEFENHMSYTALDEPCAGGGKADGEKALSDGSRLKDWLGEQLPQIRFTPFLKSLVMEVTGEETDPLHKAKLIYDYITSHVNYSFVRSYFTITDIPGYAASGQKGDCGIQALLFITMCRIAGIPARWQAGLYASPRDIGCHDWAQFYIEPYGWLYADCSFGGGAYRDGKEERREFYFGNLDPFRIPMNSEFGWQFTPPMRWHGNDPYDNQMGEAECEDRALVYGEFETLQEIVEIREL